MTSTLSIAKRYWFLIGISCVVPAGILEPGCGRVLSSSAFALPALVALTLAASGFLIEADRLRLQATNVRAILWTLTSTFIAAPVAGFLLARLWEPPAGALQEEFFREAIVLTAAQASTLASAMAFTLMAGGDGELALVLTVLSNVLTVFLTPLILQVAIGAQGSFPVGDMMLRMGLIVLLPVVVGQGLRRALLPRAGAWLPAVRTLPPAIMLIFVYAGFSTAAAHLRQDLWLVARIFCACGSLHVFLLAWTLGGAHVLGLTRGARVAVVLCGSQKTLPNGMYLWRTFFVSNPHCPVALVLFHVFQLLADTLLLTWIGGSRTPRLEARRGGKASEAL